MATKGEGKAYKFLVDHIDHPDKDACLTWPFARERHGRGMLGHNGKHYWAHRLMCILVHGDPPSPEHQAGHDCGRGHEGCVNPHHVKWKTVSENAKDRWAHNPHLRLITQANGTAGMITSVQAQAIRDAKGMKTQVELSIEFGVSENVVQNIWAGRTYRPDSKISYWTREQTDLLRTSLASGMNFPQVADVLGKPLGSVCNKAYRLGLSSGQPIRKIYDPPRDDCRSPELPNGQSGGAA